MNTGFSELDSLAKNGFDIKRLSPYHFRVNGRFDVFPTFRHSAWAFHDIAVNIRGKVAAEMLVGFVPKWIEEHQAVARERVYVKPTERGWWNCPISPCQFKMRDDFSAASAKRALEHLETHE